MPTEKQKANLRRGPGNRTFGARGVAAKAALAAQEERMGRLAVDDPYGYLNELHAIMGRNVLKLLRAEERAGGRPSREVTDRLREYRVLTEALGNVRKAQEPDASAIAFLEALEPRLAAIGEDMQLIVRPLLGGRYPSLTVLARAEELRATTEAAEE